MDIFDRKRRRKLRLGADANALLRHITGSSCEQFVLDVDRQMNVGREARDSLAGQQMLRYNEGLATTHPRVQSTAATASARVESSIADDDGS